MAAGKKLKTEGVGEKNEKEGKRGKEKGEKRLKNASLRVENSKKFAPPVASTVVGVKKMIEMYNKYPCMNTKRKACKSHSLSQIRTQSPESGHPDPHFIVPNSNQLQFYYVS